MNKAQKLTNLSNITQKWVNLLVPLSSDYSQKFFASELSRKTNIPQQTVSRYLNQMAKLNLIGYVKEGRNKMFYLDLKKQTTRIILNIIEQYKSLYFELKTKETALIINELLEYCESIIVFGSYASGNYSKESDLDLVVLGKSDKNKVKRLKQKYTIKINEHYTTYNQFAKIIASGNPLSIEIMKNHLLFGNVSEIIGIFRRAL